MKCRKWLKGQTEDNTMDLIMKLWILCLEDQDLSSGSLQAKYISIEAK